MASHTLVLTLRDEAYKNLAYLFYIVKGAEQTRSVSMASSIGTFFAKWRKQKIGQKQFLSGFLAI
jgi:hypothetical protein